MPASPVLWNLSERGVATVTLNRPEVNNAYDGALIQGVLAAMDELGTKPQLRVVVLKGNGKHFQAGADLKWINGVRPQSVAENEAASRATFEAVQRLNTLPIPTVALVQGGCFGGGTGVIAACDVVIAADNALFSITEVRWGLTAAIIIPQLCDAIGVRQVRRYALTGERFGAEDARRIGLVHEVVPLAELEAAGAKVVYRRQHALDQRAVIGVVDLRPVERDGGDPAVVEIPQDWVGGHGRSSSRCLARHYGESSTLRSITFCRRPSREAHDGVVAPGRKDVETDAPSMTGTFHAHLHFRRGRRRQPPGAAAGTRRQRGFLRDARGPSGRGQAERADVAGGE